MDTLYQVSVAVRFVLEIHFELEQSWLEPRRTIDEGFGVLDRMLLSHLLEKSFGQTDVPSWTSWIEHDVKPEPLTINLDDRLMSAILFGSHPFEIRLLHLVMDGQSSVLNAETLNYQYIILE